MPYDSGSWCSVNRFMCPLMFSYYHSPDNDLHSLLCGLEGVPKLLAPVPVVVVSVSLGFGQPLGGSPDGTITNEVWCLPSSLVAIH